MSSSAFARAVDLLASSLPRPALYGPNGSLIPDSFYSYRRQGAKQTGSLKNWLPQKFYLPQVEAFERERILERSIDLVNNDPHAAGVVDTFGHTVVGAGLTPYPVLNPVALPLDKETLREIQRQERAVYARWEQFADVGRRTSFGWMQHLAMRSCIEYGEFLMLIHMVDDPARPYMLACQLLNPLRLKTPTDMVGKEPLINQGIEVGQYSEPVAYWVKKSSAPGMARFADNSANFHRIPAFSGHRPNVLHGFIAKEPEQVRGYPFFAPALKMFRDLNDLLDAELVSNIVTAAFSLFIESAPQADPYTAAINLATSTDDTTDQPIRYQEMIPGQIMYGSTGEKPHPIAASRPGVTFDPFVKLIKKALAASCGIPYTILFKDPEGLNFAGWRGAMLDAWRVFTAQRDFIGSSLCQPVYTMLQEEAYLKGELSIPDFYLNMHLVTQAEWRGSPKGDIEPIKAVQADVEAIQGNLKTRAEAIAERGGDLETTFDQLEEEQQMMQKRNLAEAPVMRLPGEGTGMGQEQEQKSGGTK